MNDEKTVELDLELVYQTTLAFLCREPVTGDNAWVPKSLISDPEVSDLEDMIPDVLVHMAGDYPSVTLTVPEWFAIQEEFV